MPTVLALRFPAKHGRATRAEASQYRALERLYARQAAIQELIGALERYQDAAVQGRNAVLPIDGGRRTGTALRRRKSRARA